MSTSAASPSAPTLQFLGAAGTVTGSRYLLEYGDSRILVDCGLFQGYKQLRERNRRPFPVDPASVDAVLLTHAHLDHSGYIPALVRDGFHGAVHATAGTTELCGLILPDSGHLLEEEAAFARRHRTSSHHDPAPLYTAADALASLRSFHEQPFFDELALGSDITATFVPAGHILGASQIVLSIGGVKVHFTGDLGRKNDPLMRSPQPLGSVDVLVTESTYGDRVHPAVDPASQLADVVNRITKKGGVVLMPAFAVGRTETLLLHLSRLRQRGEIPDIPIFLNSPMAVNATEIYARHQNEHRISEDEFRRMYSMAKLVRTVDESKLLNLRGGPMVIISASGMLTGGRILHHILAYGSDPHNAIVLTGFQAGGTRGAALLQGADHLRIYGADVPIAAEVVDIGTLSAHADSNELMAWMKAAPTAPAQTYVIHGEPQSADALRARIKHELGWAARVPEQGQIVRLVADSRLASAGAAHQPM